jgi:hypothetical protein
VEQPRLVAHYCGSPQGRGPLESQSHGCTLVEVNEDRQMRLRHVTTDTVRWHTEQLSLVETADASNLLNLLRERTRRIAAEHHDRPVLVTWELVTGYRLAASLRYGGLCDELLFDLNQAAATAHYPVWTVAIEATSAESLPRPWLEENTILGDYLRALQTFQAGSEPLRLAEFAGQREPDDVLQELLQISDARQRDELLAEVALLGAELLRGELATGEGISGLGPGTRSMSY